MAPIGASRNCLRWWYFTSPGRGIGYSFQLAITAPLYSIIGYCIATAQSYPDLEFLPITTNCEQLENCPCLRTAIYLILKSKDIFFLLEIYISFQLAAERLRPGIIVGPNHLYKEVPSGIIENYS